MVGTRRSLLLLLLFGCPTKDGLCPDGSAPREDGSCAPACPSEARDENGECIVGPCSGVECAGGTVLDPQTCICNPAACDCSGTALPPGATGLTEQYVPLAGGTFQCECVATGC